MRRYRLHRMLLRDESAWRQKFDFQRDFHQNKLIRSGVLHRAANTETVHAVYRRPSTIYCRHQNTTRHRSSQPGISPRSSKMKWPRFVYRLQQLRCQRPSLSSCHQLRSMRSLNSNNCSPCKWCQLDPISTWFLKRLSTHVTPVICYLLQSYNAVRHLSISTQRSSCPAAPQEVRDGSWQLQFL